MSPSHRACGTALLAPHYPNFFLLVKDTFNHGTWIARSEGIPIASELMSAAAQLGVLTEPPPPSEVREGDPLHFGSGPRGWIRAGSSFLAVLTTLLILLQVFYVGSTEGDPDIWWHMRNAAYLLQHHSLPNHDTYTFTVAGQPWMNHEWLAELPYYFAFRAF